MTYQVWVDAVATVTYAPTVTEDEAEKFEKIVLDVWNERRLDDTDLHCMGELKPQMITYFMCELGEYAEEGILTRIITDVARDTETPVMIRVHLEYNVDEEDDTETEPT